MASVSPTYTRTPLTLFGIPRPEIVTSAGVFVGVRRGTSAHQQVEIYEQARNEGADKHEALVKVVDFLIEESVAGL